MKELKIILVVLMIALPIWGVYRYIENMSPVWEVTAAQQAAIDLQQRQKDAQTDIEAHAQRAQDWTEAQQALLWVIVAGVGCTLSVGLWAHYDKRRESWARPVDGQYALQTYSHAGQVWTVDPNKSVFGVFGQDKRTGQITTDANMIGPDRQLTYVMSIQRTRTAAAVTGGDGFKYAATGKFLAGGYDRPGREEYRQLEVDEDDQELPPNWQPLTVLDAFNQSTADQWILGQSHETGETFTLNPRKGVHFGIVGATGTGKTSYIGLLIMAYALKNKFRVVILDGKGGADWSKYKDLVEYSTLDYGNVGDIVGQMTAEYDKRQVLLNDFGVNSIWELPKQAATPRPTLFMFDEFGAVMDGLKAASKIAYKSVELELSNLLRLSRGAGMYVALFDQNPTKWPGTVRANMPMNICFKLGGNIGNAVTEYNLNELDREGHFQVDGERYHAWPTYTVIDELLGQIDYKKPKALLTMQQELQPKKRRPDDDSVITVGGGFDGKNDNAPPTIIDSAIAIVSPVSDSAINSGDSGDSAIDNGHLKGKPVSKKDIDLVRNTFALTNSRKETCRLLWGSWTVSRDKWVKEIIGESAQ